MSRGGAKYRRGRVLITKGGAHIFVREPQGKGRSSRSKERLDQKKLSAVSIQLLGDSDAFCERVMWGSERINLGKMMYLKSLATITIDCVLSSVAPQYQADGCIYEMSGTDRRMRTPGSLKAGDLVKVRLWLPNDDTHIFIQLAEVRWVRNQWVGIEFITMDSRERARLIRYSQEQEKESVSAACDQILIRA